MCACSDQIGSASDASAGSGVADRAFAEPGRDGIMSTEKASSRQMTAIFGSIPLPFSSSRGFTNLKEFGCCVADLPTAATASSGDALGGEPDRPLLDLLPRMRVLYLGNAPIAPHSLSPANSQSSMQGAKAGSVSILRAGVS